MRIGINGFGRIGRLTLRALLERHPEVEIVGINDLAEIGTAIHQLRYDSNYGQFERTMEEKGSEICIDGMAISYLSTREWDQLPWGDLGADLVVEATGVGTERARAAGHLEAGARTVLISAPSSDADMTIVQGENESQFDPAAHTLPLRHPAVRRPFVRALIALHESRLAEPDAVDRV